MIGKWMAKSFLKLAGWQYEHPGELWGPQQVVVGFPHTSNWDGIRSLAMFVALDLKVSLMIKAELFKGPMGSLLRAMNCIPVTRNRSTNTVDQVAGYFERRDYFTLVMSPEGTRTKTGKNIHAIRTGFWHIAKAAEVPIILMFSDNAAKCGRFIGRIVPGDSKTADLRKLQAIYGTMGLEVVIPETP